MKDKEFTMAYRITNLFYHLRAYLKNEEIGDGLLNHLSRMKCAYLELFESFDKLYGEAKLNKKVIEEMDEIFKKAIENER